jgi:hypothetical protein
METLGNVTWEKGKLEECLSNIYDDNNLIFNDWNKKYGGKFSTELIIIPKQKINMIKKFKNLFEVIVKNKQSKIYIDLDIKPEKNQKPISYNDLTELLNGFSEYLKLHYNVINSKIKYNIYLSTDDNNLKKDLNEKFIKSVHIIYNVYCDNNKIVQQIVKNYGEHNNVFKDFIKNEIIDMRVYDNNKRFRTILQSKPDRTDSLKKIFVENDNVILKKQNNNIENYLDNHISSEDFVTFIDKNKDIYIEEEITETEDIKSEFNITYKLNQITKLKKYMNETKEKNYNNSKSWFYILNTILQVIYFYEGNLNNIIENEFIKDFLIKSQVGKYKNNDSQIENIKIIKKNSTDTNKLLTFTNKDFKMPLTCSQLNNIYDFLQIDIKEQIEITHVTIDNKNYYVFNGLTKEYGYYNYSNHFILKNVSVHENENKKKYLKCEDHINLKIEEIKSKNYNKNKKINYITDLSIVPNNPNDSTYTIAPVGSGKSYLVMNKDITNIFKNPNNKILIVSDTISVSTKSKADIEKIFENIGIDLNTLLFYQDEKVKKNKNNNKVNVFENIKCYVTCYNSIKIIMNKFKPTHIILDEFKNIQNAITKIQKDHIYEKQEIANFFFDLLNDCQAIKFYDANIYDYDIDFFEKFINKNISYYQLINNKQYNNEIIFNSYNNQIDKVIEYVKTNKKFVISSATNSFAKKIQEIIREHATNDKKFLFIEPSGAYTNENANDTQEQKRELKTKILRNFDLCSEYDYVIYTPTIQTGISFNETEIYETIFHFVGEGNDYLQQAQMVHRFRKTISKQINICSINNHLSSVTSDKFISSNVKNETENANLFIGNIVNKTTNKYYKNNSQLKTELSYCDKPYNFIECINKYRENENDYLKMYKFIEILYNWGSNIIKYNFYDSTQSEQIIYDENRLEQIAMNSIIKIQRDSWLKHDFIDFNRNDINNQLSEIEIKSMILKKYGFTTELYNQIKLLNPYYEYKFFSELTDSSCFNVLNKTNENIFNKISNIKYYEVKELIYFIFDNIQSCFNNTQITNNKIKNNDILNSILSNNSVEDYKGTFKFITKIYMCFKIFDIYGLDFNELKSFYYTHNAIRFDNQIEIFTNDFLNNNKSLVSYITDNEYIKSDYFLKFCFSKLFIEYSQKEKTIKPANKNIKFRFQQNRYYKPEINGIQISNNAADDIMYWYQNEEKSYGIYIKELPKIQLFNTHNESKDIMLLTSLFDIIFKNDIYNYTLLYSNFTSLLKSVKDNIFKQIISFDYQSQELIYKIENNFNEEKININESVREKCVEDFDFKIYENGIAIYNDKIIKYEIDNTRGYDLKTINFFGFKFFIHELVFKNFGLQKTTTNEIFINHYDNDTLNNNIENLYVSEIDNDLENVKQNKKIVAKEEYKEREKDRLKSRNEKCICDICGETYTIKNKARHYKKHT